ncbi:LpxI family protein [Caenispirillum salinarum]|uniref:LpxI family protein n=1 Tax=Caenispirillum salinarum TaxID=859058 RepID=UPI003850BCA4
MPRKLGIIAGRGTLPARLARACRDTGRPVFVLALKDNCDAAALGSDVEQAWIRMGEAGTGIRLLQEAGVSDLVMAGGVDRPTLAGLRPDWRTARFFARLGFKALGDDSLLSALTKELEGEGFTIVGADDILPDLRPEAGVLGRVAPDEQARADIARAVAVIRALGALDVGQGAVVQQGIVLGVEAVEGTDALLARCKSLGRSGPGGVLVKLCKPGQETRADLPTIGPDTISNAAAAGLRGVAVHAGLSLMLDREATVAAADRAGLFVVAIDPEEPA